MFLGCNRRSSYVALWILVIGLFSLPPAHGGTEPEFVLTLSLERNLQPEWAAPKTAFAPYLTQGLPACLSVIAIEEETLFQAVNRDAPVETLREASGGWKAFVQNDEGTIVVTVTRGFGVWYFFRKLFGACE